MMVDTRLWIVRDEAVTGNGYRVSLDRLFLELHGCGDPGCPVSGIRVHTAVELPGVAEDDMLRKNEQ
jgi:hypothetical protein